MNGTLNANVSSTAVNAAWAHIKSLERQLDALKGDVNADTTLIASLQKELDEYKTSQAEEINSSYINAYTLLDVKGSTRLEGDVTIDGNTSAREINAMNLVVATSERNITQVSSSSISTKTVSATNFSGYSGNFTEIEGVDTTITNSVIFKGTNGSIKRKYVYGNYWEQMKDLIVVDVRGVLLSEGKVTYTVTGLYNQTDTKIYFTRIPMGKSGTYERIPIDDTWTSTPEANDGYRFIVDYYEV